MKPKFTRKLELCADLELDIEWFPTGGTYTTYRAGKTVVKEGETTIATVERAIGEQGWANTSAETVTVEFRVRLPLPRAIVERPPGADRK